MRLMIPTPSVEPDTRVRRGLAALVLSGLLVLLPPRRALGEDRVEYRYENYAEDRGRIGIQTHGVYFEKELTSKVVTHGQFVYDGISGATPTGAKMQPGATEVPTMHMEDERLAGSLDTAIRYGRHTTTPQVAYSHESDYESVGLALNHTIDFNQRNTTLLLGAARNFDRVKGRFQEDFQNKGTWDGIIGINQLLSPKTTLTVNLTLSYSDGYLSDPYKAVYFSFPYEDEALNVFPDAYPEKRPEHRFKQVGYVALTQFFDSVQGSGELSYRFHHDDYGIVAHTAQLAWFQKIGKQIVISPMIRYYQQSAADFYAPRFTGDLRYPDGTQLAYQNGSFIAELGEPEFPSDPTGYDIVTVPAAPSYYSADYRLAHLDTWSYGIGISWKPTDWLSLNFGYRRYEMNGLDGVTLASAFPKANIFTVGLGIWF